MHTNPTEFRNSTNTCKRINSTEKSTPTSIHYPVLKILILPTFSPVTNLPISLSSSIRTKRFPTLFWAPEFIGQTRTELWLSRFEGKTSGEFYVRTYSIYIQCSMKLSREERRFVEILNYLELENASFVTIFLFNQRGGIIQMNYGVTYLMCCLYICSD